MPRELRVSPIKIHNEYKRSIDHCKTVIPAASVQEVTTTEEMKSLLIYIALTNLVAACIAADQIPIIRKEQKVVGDNKAKDYKFVIETANGIYQEEQGIVKNADDPGSETQLAEGQYQYVSPEGEVIQVHYTADERGFIPMGSHIPTPPPIPKEIQKALDYLATKKPDPEDSSDEGSFLDLPK